MDKLPKYLTKDFLKNLTPNEEAQISQHLKTQWEKITHKAPGWRFRSIGWIDIHTINTKDKFGQVINTIRIGGTGTQDTLEGSVIKGWDTDEPLIALWKGPITDQDLLDAFNRLREFIKQGYRRLPVAFYERHNPTIWQKTDDNAVDDFRAVANKDKGQKPISRDEIIKLVTERFEDEITSKTDFDLLKTTMAQYLGQLDLHQTPEQINGIITVCIRDFKRRGNIEFYSREDAEKYVNDFQKVWADSYEETDDEDLNFQDFDPFVVNTKDSTRSLRLWKQVMEHFVEHGINAPVISFDSGATSHKEIDLNLKQTEEELIKLQKLTLNYVAAYHYHKGTIPVPTWTLIGSIPQKIRKNVARVFNKFEGLVDAFS